MLYRWVRYRKYALLALVVLAVVTLLALQQRHPAERRFLADVTGALSTPVQEAVSRLHRGATALWSRYLDWKAIRADHARLRAEVEALRLRQLRLEETEEENARLRWLLGLQARLPLEGVAAEVVAREWAGFTRALTVNRGRADGVARLAPVIVPEGVVGRVQEARRGSAVIQLLTDPGSSIGALVVRTRSQGLVEGQVGGGLRLRLPASEERVAPGDLVVTSGLGGTSPKGIPLGRIERMGEATALFRYAELTPSVNLARVEEVLILKRGARGDLTGLFPEG